MHKSQVNNKKWPNTSQLKHHNHGTWRHISWPDSVLSWFDPLDSMIYVDVRDIPKYHYVIQISFIYYIFSREIACFIHWIKGISSHCENIEWACGLFFSKCVWGVFCPQCEHYKLSWRHVIYCMHWLRFEVPRKM